MKFIHLCFTFVLLNILFSCKKDVTVTSKKPQSSFEIISGCKKEISRKLFDKKGKDSLEWKKSYDKSGKQTCDFTAYVIIKKKFSNGNLIEQTQFISCCDECDEKPCGKWLYFNANGEKIREKDFGECSFEKFDKQ